MPIPLSLSPFPIVSTISSYVVVATLTKVIFNYAHVWRSLVRLENVVPTFTTFGDPPVLLIAHLYSCGPAIVCSSRYMFYQLPVSRSDTVDCLLPVFSFYFILTFREPLECITLPLTFLSLSNLILAYIFLSPSKSSAQDF